MARIAVYGKGGIGKSTISANLSIALTRAGKHVLQIGCDPKHDSTRLLLGGRELTTVLDYMRVTGPMDYKLSDILEEGYMGIGCVEAGGPKPGVGCAGRGIISTFELLDQFKLGDRYDTTLYDVLGDVVCGGFAVPIRREYADTILIVTSGEFMALYAANNILRGIQNFDGDQKRVAGLVFNRRAVADEDERVHRFAEAVGLPIFADVPRSDAFTRAEQKGITAMENADDPDIVQIFDDMAARLVGGCELHAARPLSDSDLEATVLGISRSQSDTLISPEVAEAHAAADEIERIEAPDAHGGIDLTSPNRYLSKSVKNSDPLQGCAFNGAISTAVHLNDAIILAHASKSCAYISLQTTTSTGRRRLFERGSLLPASLSPNLECTELGQPEIVFGGMDKLEAKVRELEAGNPPAIVVISACVSGIIGDDIDQVRDLSTPETTVVPIRTDGNMTGDYMQGMFMAYTELAHDIIDPTVEKVPNTVNIISEKMVVTATEQNFELISGFLARMGVTVNCRFLYNTSTESLRKFTSAELLLPAYSDYTAQTLTRFFEDEYGCEVFDLGFPVGYDQTCTWLRRIGERFGKEDVAEELIEEEELKYEEDIRALRPDLEGRKLMVITFNSDLDWILKPALDCGMEVVKIGAVDYSQDEGFRSNLGVDLPVELHYNPDSRASDIEELRPDVLLTNYASSVTQTVKVNDTIPMCPESGFESGIVLVKRWALLLRMDLEGDWKDDAELFDEYYVR